MNRSVPGTEEANAKCSAASAGDPEENSSAAALRGEPQTHYLLAVQFQEIYNENVYDLLIDETGPADKRTALPVREHAQRGFFVPNLTRVIVRSKKELMKWISRGHRNRIVSATHQNSQSSRGHSILTLEVEKKTIYPPEGNGAESLETLEEDAEIVRSTLNLVDLAGSERFARDSSGSLADVSARKRKETGSINKSLSILAKVISTLAEQNSNSSTGNGGSTRNHVPYRESKLTRVLKDSLGGNSQTLMITCIHPTPENYRESVNSLSYAQRAKQVRNNPHKVAPELNHLQSLHSELRRLRRELALSEDRVKQQQKRRDSMYSLITNSMATLKRRLSIDGPPPPSSMIPGHNSSFELETGGAILGSDMLESRAGSRRQSLESVGRLNLEQDDFTVEFQENGIPAPGGLESPLGFSTSLLQALEVEDVDEQRRLELQSEAQSLEVSSGLSFSSLIWS